MWVTCKYLRCLCLKIWYGFETKSLIQKHGSRIGFLLNFLTPNQNKESFLNINYTDCYIISLYYTLDVIVGVPSLVNTPSARPPRIQENSLPFRAVCGLLATSWNQSIQNYSKFTIKVQYFIDHITHTTLLEYWNTSRNSESIDYSLTNFDC